ncbi:DNA-binding IclR family transcriptional regulator [Sphingomonas kyeonggiensis]|uniref:DNA-binding IclR family transcriptional regulator n=1 Tax=Sphingomonas kyeonggiensis TaxID=1268553 RepID=A0A7W7JZA9_9SPHN|nr:IclR family transcriptional regulator [Sphingomonas kyeonggiensis]MBB4838124.1 DNA-binding IclR family transcriptional regulator [Sphingomonas kyeonggiensis]
MTESTEGEADKRRRGIQSVEIGLGVLEALAALGEASTLGAIAQASGLSGPQTHRYLASLTAAGMTQQDRTTGRYDLGPAALKLGLSALARTDAFRVADTAIEAFVRETGRTVQVAALGPQGPTVVRWHMGRPAVMTSFGVGAVLPLLYSATGHIFLSFVPEVETDPLLERELADSEMTAADVAAIRKRVRADGRAYVEGTVIPGLRAAAFPIFDMQGRAILSATALVPGAYKADDSGAVLDKLAASCREVSERLGWSG